MMRFRADVVVLVMAILLVFAPTGRAGLLGPDESAPETSVPAAAAPKPYSPLSTTATGTCTAAATVCAGTPCASGHACECVTLPSLAVKLPGVGVTGLSVQLNLDTNESTPTGVSACLSAYGIGTGTAKNGDTVKVSFNGQFCGGASSIDDVSGGWLVTGGTGSLVNANGTGLYAASVSDLFGPHACVFTMDGTFRKAP